MDRKIHIDSKLHPSVYLQISFDSNSCLPKGMSVVIAHPSKDKVIYVSDIPEEYYVGILHVYDIDLMKVKELNDRQEGGDRIVRIYFDGNDSVAVEYK